ncbi:MAG: transcriptional regulator [Thermodesulfovibrionales bacterium]|jgi:predicted Zn-ribbon and HTH transcriptional regulator
MPEGITLVNKPREPVIPRERHETLRKEIIAILVGRTLSVKEISAEVRVSEKEVYEHLEHIRRTQKRGHDLVITPAECRKCGFVFKKREKLQKPGRCPLCRNESIQEPVFSIQEPLQRR